MGRDVDVVRSLLERHQAAVAGAAGDCLKNLLRLLFNRRTRRAVRGLIVLRHVNEYVLVLATLEGVRTGRTAYYEAYVDALNILGERAKLITWSL
jgi:RecB family endonuclease NucS